MAIVDWRSGREWATAASGTRGSREDRGRRLENGDYTPEERYVLKKVDGIEYLRTKVKLKRVGSVYRCVCPFHAEHTASFTVYPPTHPRSRGWTSWFCYGCNQGGDVIKFKLMYDELSSRTEALKALERELGIDYTLDAQLRETKAELERFTCQQPSATSLQDVNWEVSLLFRRYLSRVKDLPDFKDMLTAGEAVMAKVDEALVTKSAVEVQGLSEAVRAALEGLLSKKGLSFS